MKNNPAYDNTEMLGVVERNIKALIDRKKEDETKRTTQDKIVDKMMQFMGSMPFVYLHVIFFGCWFIWDKGFFSLKPFDPNFIDLATFAAVEAIFLSTFVLISQNLMNVHADKRAELDLQISLLTEHEVTRMLTLVSAMAKKMGVEEAYDKELEELAKDIHPEKVMDSMEKASSGSDDSSQTG